MPIPVILDTDIGTDVDDVWALAFFIALSGIGCTFDYHIHWRYPAPSGIGSKAARRLRAARMCR